MPLVPLLMAVLLLLYSAFRAHTSLRVQGASIPLFGLRRQQLMPAECRAVNMVSSLASLVGPVLGRVCSTVGTACGRFYGCKLCMLGVFRCDGNIHPHPAASRRDGGSISASRRRIWHGACGYFPGKACCGTHHFAGVRIQSVHEFHAHHRPACDFAPDAGCGYAALWSFTGRPCGGRGLRAGDLAGVLGSGWTSGRAHFLLLGCALGILPMGLSHGIGPASAGYVIVAVCSFMLMVLSTLFSVQMMALQSQTPGELVAR